MVGTNHTAVGRGVSRKGEHEERDKSYNSLRDISGRGRKKKTLRMRFLGSTMQPGSHLFFHGNVNLCFLV